MPGTLAATSDEMADIVRIRWDDHKVGASFIYLLSCE